MRNGRFPVSRVAKPGALLDEAAETLVVVADVVVGSGGMGHAEEFLQVADHSDAVSVVTGAQSPGDVGVSGQGLVDVHHERETLPRPGLVLLPAGWLIASRARVPRG